MDLACLHAKSNGFLIKNSFSEKPIYWSSTMDFEIRVSKKVSIINYRKHRSISVRAAGKKSQGNSDNTNSNSGNNDQSKTPPSKSVKPLDWREFRAMLYVQEKAGNSDSGHTHTHEKPPPNPSKWAHPISAPENGCLLIATEKLDGVRTFERSVVLLLRSGTKNPQEGPFGVVINRPLHKKMKNMSPTNIELATTFADCSLHFGGPLDASMFLLKEKKVRPGFEEVIPGVYFGSRNSLDEASRLVKKGEVKAGDFRFFVGYAGWQIDQLQEEIESEYWYVAACSEHLIFGGSSGNLWEEILQRMGGRYSELSRKPKQDI